MAFRPGPRSTEQLLRFKRSFRQGQHVLITGPTNSGKTTLARYVDQVRLDAGGVVVVLVGKLKPDATLTKDYAGWVRWKSMRTITGRVRRPSQSERRILLWPDTDRDKTLAGKRATQKGVFRDAFDVFTHQGDYTVHNDEGQLMASPQMGFADDMGMLHAIGRSSHLTMLTLAQRPSHLPLLIYSNLSHAFVGRTKEESDRKRLAELGANVNSRELGKRISDQTLHQFTWIPLVTDGDPETVELNR